MDNKSKTKIGKVETEMKFNHHIGFPLQKAAKLFNMGGYFRIEVIRIWNTREVNRARI